MIETTETHHPAEWLRQLRETPGAYDALLDDSHSLAHAAYRVARARCRVQPIRSVVPTVRELGAAATELRKHSVQRLPDTNSLRLAEECEAWGMRVILPISTHAA